MNLHAGQGYIWLAHRQPGTPGWAVAKRSKHLWECMLKRGLEGQESSTYISLGTKEDVEWQVKATPSFVRDACLTCVYSDLDL